MHNRFAICIRCGVSFAKLRECTEHNFVALDVYKRQGEESGVPIIRELIKNLPCKNNIIDCPPGSACTVMESIKEADYCVIVAEPSIFGVHNFQMVYKLVKILKKPFGIVINKVNDLNNPMQELCEKLQLPVLEQIPFACEIAAQNAAGNLVYETNQKAKEIFERLYAKISEVVK